MVTYEGRRREPLKPWQRLAAVGSVVLVALVGAVVARAFDGVWDWSTSSKPAPEVHLIDQGAAPDSTLADVFAGVVIPAEAVKGDPPGPGDEEITVWAGDGAVPASGTGQSLQITAPDKALVITEIKPRVLTRESPIVGAFVGPSGAGTFLQYGVLADLDSDPVATEFYSDDADWSFPISMGNDDNMVFTVVGSTSSGTVEWVVDIHYLVDGEANILTFPDETNPFVTTSVGSATKWWEWGSGWSEGAPAFGGQKVTPDPTPPPDNSHCYARERMAGRLARGSAGGFSRAAAARRFSVRSPTPS